MEQAPAATINPIRKREVAFCVEKRPPPSGERSKYWSSLDSVLPAA